MDDVAKSTVQCPVKPYLSVMYGNVQSSLVLIHPIFYGQNFSGFSNPFGADSLSWHAYLRKNRFWQVDTYEETRFARLYIWTWGLYYRPIWRFCRTIIESYSRIKTFSGYLFGLI